MSETVISVEKLGKKYLIKHDAKTNESYTALRDSISNIPKRCLKHFQSNHHSARRKNREEFWALKDVSFEVKRGETIGIVGRNGAGKSTLLKLLSRITDPTTGAIVIKGRVASLLEVGTGFHPELTGRENIYLNGAVLGMRKSEVTRKFDEIVDFAEVETFLDTPVKRYSSGMAVKLAFAVAAHLEQEILILDEVLAVGDAAFQKKCLKKVDQIGTTEGRTVLFVTHNLATTLGFCNRGIWMDKGEISMTGSMRDVVDAYLSSDAQLFGEKIFDTRYKAENSFHFNAIRTLNKDKRKTSKIDLLEGVSVELDYTILKPLRGLKVGFKLINASGLTVLHSSDIDEMPSQSLAQKRAAGFYSVQCHISSQFLRPGTYSLSIWAGYPGLQTLDEYFNVVHFEVVDTGSAQALIGENSEAIIAPVIRWSSPA